MSGSTIAWIVALVVLYLIGYYEGRATGYRKRKKEEQKEQANQAPPEPAVVTETVTKTVTVDDPGMLRIKTEEAGFTLDLDGARVNPISLLPEQRKRLIEILSIMRPWLEGRPAPPPASKPAPAPISAPTSAPASSGIAPVSQSSLLDRIQSKPAPLAPDTPTPPTPAADARQAAPAQPAFPPASPPPAAPKPATIAKEDRPAAPDNSMVSQVDAILQSNLAGTPLEERGIFLAQSPEGGVIVYVGLTRYNGPEEVPDPDIKAAIRAATTEWEHKYTPGLK